MRLRQGKDLLFSLFILQGYARPGGSHLCEDIDECKLGLHDCAEDQICQNFPGYFQCIFNEEDSNAEKPELVPYNFDEGRTNLRHAVPIAEERDELVGQERS